MDGVEKRVFRRKHVLLSVLLQPTRTYLTLLKQQGMVSTHMEQAVLAAETKKQMPTLLTLLESGPDTTFSKVTFMLEQTGHSWVADEISADLQYEQGKLPLEDYILTEAEYHANTLLGDKGYIDVQRKADLVRSIAGRHQVAKEAWNRQMNRKNKHVVDELQTVQKDVLKMFEEVDDFLRAKNKLNLVDTGRVGPMKSTDNNGKGHKTSTNAAVGRKIGDKEEVTYGAAIQMLQTKINTLNHALENEITQHEKLHSERERCYELLNVEPSTQALDVVLHEALIRLSKELGQKSSETENKKKQVTSLDKQIRGLKQDVSSQIVQKNIHLEHLNRTLHQTEKQVRDAKEDFSDMTKKRDICKAQMDYWKDRCEMLEKTRRLGYYHISKFSQPVSLADVQNTPGPHSKKFLHYDPDLLEVNDNVVYIKGESKAHWRSGDSNGPDKKPTTQKQGVVMGGYNPNKGTKRVDAKDKTSHEVVKINPYPPRPVSQYHTRCVPSDDLNTNYNNNNNNNNNSKNTSSSYVDKKQPQKSSLKSSKSNSGSSDKSRSTQGQDGKKHLSFNTKTYENELMKTAGINTSPYSTQMLPVYPYIGQAAVTTTTSKGSSNGMTHKYEVRQPQTLPSGIYRPAPPPNTAPRRDGAKTSRGPAVQPRKMDDRDDRIRSSTVTPSGYVSYTNGMLGLSQGTQTATTTPSSIRSDSISNIYTQTPKEKFEETLQREALKSAESNNQSNVTSQASPSRGGVIQSNMSAHEMSSSNGLDQSYSSSQSRGKSSGYSSFSSGQMSDSELPPHNSEPARSAKQMEGSHVNGPQGKGHCRCCKACCKEAPTHHPYQGYIS